MLLGIAIIVVAIIGAIAFLKMKRRERLMLKYNDAEIVDKIMNKRIWQGMSQEQLIDSWGSPVTKDQKHLKTKTTEIFKYNQTGKNRFSNRVRVENGIVVGWEKK